jgi:hypothetical protein
MRREMIRLLAQVIFLAHQPHKLNRDVSKEMIRGKNVQEGHEIKNKAYK